jgi:hypothetical protein
MSKKTAGFATQRGTAWPAKGTGYSQDELNALSKIDANPNNIDSNAVVLCEHCGSPVSSPSKYERPEDKYSFFEQTKMRQHFACAMEKQRIVAERQKRAEDAAQARYDALPQDEKDAIEDAEARKWNEGNTADPRGNTATLTTPYRHKPGELSLEKVQQAGGVSKALAPELPATFEFRPETDPKLIEQARVREAEIAEQFKRDMEAISRGEQPEPQ